jgi:hypothetical protein
MDDGTDKKIKDIVVGDVLENANVVTSTFKLDANISEMYELNGVIVSGSHSVKYNNKWLLVPKHPAAKKLVNYPEPYIYCLNTSDKHIIINGMCFIDWDELFNDDDLDEVAKNCEVDIKTCEDVHSLLDGGFKYDTPIRMQNGINVQIDSVNVGDILEHGEKVYGIVEIDGLQLSQQYKYNLGNNVVIEGGPNMGICDEQFNETSTLYIIDKQPTTREPKLFHLLTDKKSFYIEGIRFFDYNASIDLFSEKARGNLLSMKYV